MSNLHTDVTPPDHNLPDTNPVDNQQIIYYEGSPRLRGYVGTVIICSLLGLVAASIPFLLGLADISVHWLVYVIAFIVAIAIWSYPAIVVISNRYKITNYRIDWEHGFIWKKYDTIELWHVEDVQLNLNPFERMLNVGTIRILSHDETNPLLRLEALHNPKHLMETLKTRIIAVKRQRGVLKIDEGAVTPHHHE